MTYTTYVWAVETYNFQTSDSVLNIYGSKEEVLKHVRRVLFELLQEMDIPLDDKIAAENVLQKMGEENQNSGRVPGLLQWKLQDSGEGRIGCDTRTDSESYQENYVWHISRHQVTLEK